MEIAKFILISVLFAPSGNVVTEVISEPVARSECKEMWRTRLESMKALEDNLEINPATHFTAFCMPVDRKVEFTQVE